MIPCHTLLVLTRSIPPYLHADLGGRIKADEAETKRLTDDMRHVEAVLKMFDPEFNARAIAARRRVTGNPWVQAGHAVPGRPRGPTGRGRAAHGAGDRRVENPTAQTYILAVYFSSDFRAAVVS
jgi:hypothetical protein